MVNHNLETYTRFTSHLTVSVVKTLLGMDAVSAYAKPYPSRWGETKATHDPIVFEMSFQFKIVAMNGKP